MVYYTWPYGQTKYFQKSFHYSLKGALIFKRVVFFEGKGFALVVCLRVVELGLADFSRVLEVEVCGSHFKFWLGGSVRIVKN